MLVRKFFKLCIARKKLLLEVKEKLRKVESERTEYLTGWQRAKADLINLRKQDQKRNEEVIQFANQKLIEELLPVMDSFNMAFANKTAWEEAPKDWRVGVEYIHSQFMGVLSNHRISEVSPKLGENFDPTIHEAVETEETDDKNKDHTVVSVFQKGYTLDNSVIRTAKVKVASYVSR